MLAPFSYAVPEEASRLEHLTRLLSQGRLDDERSSCHPSPLVVKALFILGNTWLFQHWLGGEGGITLEFYMYHFLLVLLSSNQTPCDCSSVIHVPCGLCRVENGPSLLILGF